MSKYLAYLRFLFVKIIFFGSLIFAFPFVFPKELFAKELSNEKPNILFIIVDDLNTRLGCYGYKEIHSPNIDKLASKGVLFSRAYCQAPMCAPSRASLLTGLRPTENRFLDNVKANVDKQVSGIMTLNRILKENGYITVVNGRAYHSLKENRVYWDEVYWPEGNRYLSKINQEIIKKGGKPPDFESADVEDNAYRSGKIADKVIADLRRLKKSSQSWFMAVGIIKPHHPWNSPKRYWNMYNRQYIKLPNNFYFPKNTPKQAFRRNEIVLSKPASSSDDLAENFIHAYYACISYADALIGKVITELERLGMRDNTIIILISDHGFLLGEHGLCGKFNFFDPTLHVPLIINAPGVIKGERCDGLVELLDIYPTLCDLINIPKPEHLEGTSFVPLLENPRFTWKDAVFSRSNNTDSVRTDRYRYTEWKNGARMLYDFKNDPNENVNISEVPENTHIVKHMHKLITGKIVPNKAPYVSAGKNMEILLSTRTILLEGIVRDDNKPRKAKLISEWKLLEGPAEAKFKDKNSPTTAVTFSKSGVYRLRLYASDGKMVGLDDVEVRVKKGFTTK